MEHIRWPCCLHRCANLSKLDTDNCEMILRSTPVEDLFWLMTSWINARAAGGKPIASNFNGSTSTSIAYSASVPRPERPNGKFKCQDLGPRAPRARDKHRVSSTRGTTVRIEPSMTAMSSTNREYDELLTEHFRYTPLVSCPPPNRYCLFS